MTIQFNNQSDIVTPSSGQLNNSATVVDKALVLQGGNNLVKYSNTLETTGSAWVSTSSSSTITATLNNIVAPDGTITGTLLTYPINVTGAGIYSTWRANIATTTTGAYTVSVWLKSGSTTSIYIRFNDSSGNRAKLLCNLTSTWQRFTISGTTATTITAISFDIGADGNASETMSAGTIYAWGAQLELGTQASAYTPTTTTAITTTNNISVPSGYLSVGTSNTTGAVTISPISSDGNVTAWGKGQVLISPAGTTTSLGLGLSIDTTNQIAYMSALTPSISWNTMGYRADNFRFLVGGATERVRIDNNGININNAWIGIGGSSITPDTIIARDAANILAQRNSTNAQTFRLYNTYTDSANNEYLSVDWTTSANSATIGTKNTGTGIARDLKLISASRYLILGTEGVNRVVVDSLVNNFYPQVNGTWDLGYITTRWRNAYFSGVVNTTDIAATGNVTIGGTLTVTGNIAFQNTTINNVTVNTTDSIVTTNTTPSTSNTTGSIVAYGGLGVAGNITTTGIISSNIVTNNLGTTASLNLMQVSNYGLFNTVQTLGVTDPGSGRIDLFSFNVGANNARGGQITFGEINGLGLAQESITCYLNQFQFAQAGNNPITFYTNGSERVRIDGSGNLGIGTVAPTSNLHVIGTANVSSSLTVGGTVTIANTTVSSNTTTGALIVNGGVGINGALNATSKSFSIPHPTKPGQTLRHGSLEGPEFGVYVRGRLTGDTIHLPEYWTKLVDPDTITVELTPIGKHQKLYVALVDNTQVIVGNENLFGKTDCFYTVYAERNDIDKLTVES